MSAREQLRATDVLHDVGWFWLTFASLVSAPSLLSLAQMVFEHRFTDALQWIVDGYNRILAVVGSAVEPLARAALAWLNEVLHWRLELHPHWRPLFIVTMLVGAGAIRNAMQFGAYRLAVVYGAGLTLGALLGALAAGLAPLDGAWWSQGFAAAAPVGMAYAGTGLQQLALARSPGASRGWQVAGAVAMVSLATFGLGAGLSFLPGLSEGAGVVTVAILVFYLGISNVFIGLFRRDLTERYAGVRSEGMQIYQVRFGLLTLGGFFAAGLIALADAVIRWLAG